MVGGFSGEIGVIGECPPCLTLDDSDGIRVSAVSSGLGALAGRPGLVSGASLIRDRAGRVGPADGGGSVLLELLGIRSELYDRLAS